MGIKLILTTGVFAAMLAPAFAQNTKPQMSGVWEIDNAKSHVVDGRNVTMTIQQTPERLTVNEIIKTSSDTKNIHFSCTIDATDCDFDEAGHKSKISLWYNGQELIACRTCGPVGDLVNEWHMRLSPDGNTLTIEVEHVDPPAGPELMVFNKKAPADKAKTSDQANK